VPFVFRSSYKGLRNYRTNFGEGTSRGREERTPDQGRRRKSQSAVQLCDRGHDRNRHRADRTEVKSIRSGKSTIAESYADSKNGELWLINANIPEYLQGNRFNHEPKRPRKLLLHRKQINKLMGAVDREGMTLIPLKLYFNERGRAKLLLAIAKGKKLHDKRETEKKRDWSREKGRLMRARG